MEIKKISFNDMNPQKQTVDGKCCDTIKSTPSTTAEKPIDYDNISSDTSDKLYNASEKSMKIPKGLIIIVLTLFVVGFIGFGIYLGLSRVIQWEDNSGGVGRKDSLSVDTSTIQNYKVNEKSDESSIPDTVVTGKITVTFVKDKEMPFDNGIVQLYSSSGKLVNSLKTGSDGTNGIVVFDGVSAGSYTVVGGREGEVEVRNVSESVSIGQGEFANVTLKLYIDTPVTITVNVSDNDGSRVVNKSFAMVRYRGDEGDEILSVVTDESGTFTKSGIYPADDWILKENDTEVARFSVEPNGKDQIINVKTNSN